MLMVENLHFSYGDKKILQGIRFSVQKNEIIALIGVSGSGKTTLFRLIAGLAFPLYGTISLMGQAPTADSLDITYMRQEDLLLPWRTVIDNVLLCSELGRKTIVKSQLREQATLLLKKMGLENSEGLYPKELSGGMRQRVALSRALLQNRALLLLDEPFASLDVIVREELYALLRDIRDHYQKTIVMVTHDFRDAIALADRVFVLVKGKIKSTYALDASQRADISHCASLTQQIKNDLSTSF